ncbi:MAG: isochorismate synthase [Chloroflexota bacterium]|nr:MAG: isochorismate synthase [Chloroflexota bacterium]
MISQKTRTNEFELALRQGFRQATRLGKPILVSVSERVGEFDALAILQRGAQMTTARAYWKAARDQLTLVGLGIAHAIDGVESPRFRQAAADWRYLLADAVIGDSQGLPGVGPLVLGGFAFDALRHKTPLWKNFPGARLVLPKLLFTKTRDEFWLTRNVVIDQETQVDSTLLTLNAFAERVRQEISRVLPRAAAHEVEMRELISAHAWQNIVADAVETIRRGDLEKVVAARAVELQADAPFDSIRALDYFSKHAPGTYQFAFAREQDIFLGATPEQLVCVRAGKLETMGLAGSMPRGATPTQDEQFGNELLASAKERSEQEIVVRAMREVLGDTCVQLQMSAAPTLLKLGSIQHLITRFNGNLANGYTLLDVVERLHPTPAVGGRPRAAALQWLREHEQLDRGWYAGAVGWVDANLEGEFSVAIRSALLQEYVATLFAGCGIVADSIPEREYAEAVLKLKPMLAALQVTGDE